VTGNLSVFVGADVVVVLMDEVVVLMDDVVMDDVVIDVGVIVVVGAIVDDEPGAVVDDAVFELQLARATAASAVAAIPRPRWRRVRRAILAWSVSRWVSMVMSCSLSVSSFAPEAPGAQITAQDRLREIASDCASMRSRRATAARERARPEDEAASGAELASAHPMPEASRTMEIGKLGIWTGALDSVSSQEARRAAARIESFGYSTLWIPETVGRDPLITSTLLLDSTSTLVVATGIANIYARDAVTTANAQRTLEEAFPGRFLLGLGVSHEHLVDRVRHHDYSKPYSKMVTYLDEMDAAVFRAVGPAERPATVLAALGPKMLALAGARANGAHTYFVPVEHTRHARQLLGDGPLLAVEQMLVLESDRRLGLEIARKGMAVYLRAPNYRRNLLNYGFVEEDLDDGGSDRLVDALVVIGGVAEVIGRVRAHLEAGASQVCLQVLEVETNSLPERAWGELAAGLADAHLL
jgi:probable F420-dependent oxidoreductase